MSSVFYVCPAPAACLPRQTEVIAAQLRIRVIVVVAVVVVAIVLCLLYVYVEYSALAS